MQYPDAGRLQSQVDASHDAWGAAHAHARANGINAIDGPYLKVRDVEAFRRVAGRAQKVALTVDADDATFEALVAALRERFAAKA